MSEYVNYDGLKRYDELIKNVISAVAKNGTYTVKTLVGSTTTNVSDFTANQSSADDVTFVQGSNVTITPDTTNRKITIAAKDTTYSAATTSAAGLMSASDKTKLNNIESGAQVHKAPTTAEVKSALGTGSGTSKYLREDGTWQTPPDTNTWRPLGTGASDACAGNDSRLSNARPASDVYSWAKASSKPSYSFSEISGTVSSSQLPSYVDDVLEYNSKSNFPTTGEGGKIYVAKDTNLTWRWSGSTYVEISPSLALGETSSTAYAGDKGAALKTKLDGIESGAQKHIAPTTAEVKSALGTGSGTSKYLREDGNWVTPPDHTYSVNNGTFTVKGAGTSVSSTSANASGNSSVDIVAGSNVTITPDATNGKITISSTNTKYNFSGTSFTSNNSTSTDANNVTYNAHTYYTSNGPATSLGASTNGALYSQAYSTSWVGQIAQDYRNGGLYVRGKNNGTWQSWYKIWDSRNLTNLNQLSNGPGYITGITKTMVTDALGYTPPTTDTNTWRPVSDSVSSTDSSTAASSKAVKTAYDLAASKTSNTGTVTKVTAGTGLTGGDITTTGTIALATSGVTAGTYKRVTVDAYGRVTSGDNTDSDTKNTAGTTNKTGTKMFLAAATEQNTNPVTYSNSNCYIGTDNCLYSGGTKVLTAHQDISGKANKSDLATVATSGSYNDLSNKPTSLPASDVSAWAKASTKPSYSYSEINYNPTEITSAGGAVSINGTNPLQVITISAAVSGITFSAVPENGHSCHLIITAASDLSVAIAHGATMFTGYTSVCPEAADVSLDITAGGYVELDLLRVGTKIYVRGV